MRYDKVLKRDNVAFLHSIYKDNDFLEPVIIQEIKDRRFYIYRADKGKDSVINGIDLIKSYELNVTEDSLNLIKEFRNYKWDTDYNTGELLNKPIDNWNHVLDSLRYCCLKVSLYIIILLLMGLQC